MNNDRHYEKVVQIPRNTEDKWAARVKLLVRISLLFKYNLDVTVSSEHQAEFAYWPFMN